MTIAHHPTDPTLAAFAAGTLDEGRALWYRRTWSAVRSVAERVRSFERVARNRAGRQGTGWPGRGGAATALQKISSDGPKPRRPPPTVIILEARPTPLSGTFAPGSGAGSPRVAMAPGGGSGGRSGTRVFMLKAAPGIRIPHHAHAGLEWTCVLQGAFSHRPVRCLAAFLLGISRRSRRHDRASAGWSRRWWSSASAWSRCKAKSVGKAGWGV